MRNGSLIALAVVLTMTAVPAVQGQPKTQEQSKAKTPTTFEMTGCVSLTPSASGQFAFVDGASGGTYRLNGKGLKKYAGQRIRILGDTSTKKVAIKTGLWPSPNIAAQAGALDPAQESIARASGGNGGIPDATPELKVVRVHGVEGACR
jgi:hypothetical protein